MAQEDVIREIFEQSRQDKFNKLHDLLQEVLDNACGDIKYPNKRVWPIQADLYRRICKAINYEYDRSRITLGLLE
jgi:hypothetical protein